MSCKQNLEVRGFDFKIFKFIFPPSIIYPMKVNDIIVIKLNGLGCHHYMIHTSFPLFRFVQRQVGEQEMTCMQSIFFHQLVIVKIMILVAILIGYSSQTFVRDPNHIRPTYRRQSQFIDHQSLLTQMIHSKGFLQAILFQMKFLQYQSCIISLSQAIAWLVHLSLGKNQVCNSCRIFSSNMKMNMRVQTNMIVDEV